MAGDAMASLFQGKKYWIAQRVPTRHHWAELLERHGGHLVKLDSQADILIADHALKAPPPGSLSWKFIEDSVNKGELQDPEDYPAGPAKTSVQFNGIQVRPRGIMTRHPFTAEDDRQLWDWVTNAEARGASIAGNKLYQELEAINPRHTWHSWRDRWLKILAHRERPVVKKNDRSPDLEAHASVDSPQRPQHMGKKRAPAPSSSNPVQHSGQAASPKKKDPVSTSNEVPRLNGAGSPSKNNLEKPSTRHKSVSVPPEDIVQSATFTGEDEKLLLSIFDEIEEIDPSLEKEAWEAWANEYPQHNSEDWKNYWLEYVRPKEQRCVLEKTHENQTLSTGDPAPKSANQSKETLLESESSSSEKELIPPDLGDRRQCQERSDALVSFLREQDFHFTKDIVIYEKWILLYDVCRAVISAFDENARKQKPGRWAEVARLIGVDQSTSNTKALQNIYSPVIAQFFDFEDFISNRGPEEAETESDAGNEEDDALKPSIRAGQGLDKRKRVQNDDEAPLQEQTIITTPTANKRTRVDRGKGREGEREIPSSPAASYDPRRDEQQRLVQDPETQDFFFSQAIQDERSLHHGTRNDSPSNQIFDEVHRATQHSPDPEPPSDEARETAARGNKLEYFMALGLGYDEDTVRQALHATTCNDDNDNKALIVMEALRNGKEIPNNLRGVWTAGDDFHLKNARGKQRMIRKHGSESVEERLMWLKVVEEVLREK